MSAGIENVSDTARWVAVYRAMETERPDAHFRDPWARTLAGGKGEDIVASLPRGRGMAWPMIVRTQLFDEVILERVRSEGVDLVLNLAAGLDTRAWRLDLPADLRWVDVDLPGILDYKLSVMESETPRCRYEALRADLTDAAQRASALLRAGEARRALVASEGLLIYLSETEVIGLARALHEVPTLRWWVTDLASPALLEMMSKGWGDAVAKAGAPFRFAPEQGSAFFSRLGWRELAWHATWREARRLRREMRGAWLWRFLGRFASAERKRGWERFSGTALLERV
jgi:methyltransferase (TIGR00027 family)